MKCLVATLGALLLPFAILALNFQEDDLVFDDGGKDFSVPRVDDLVEDVVPTTYRPAIPKRMDSEEKLVAKGRKKATSRNLNKLKNSLTNAKATVGRVFKFKIPKHFFDGNRQRYQVINLLHFLFSYIQRHKNFQVKDMTTPFSTISLFSWTAVQSFN